MSKQENSAKVALVGETVQVTDSQNPALVGLSGQAIDETRNTIVIQTLKGKKTIIKEQVTIKIANNTINGKKLTGRIENRIKQ